MEWTPLLPKRLEVDATVLARPSSTQHHPQLAKDVNYARAVQESWRSEVQSRAAESAGSSSESTPIIYKESAEGTRLYGHIVRRRKDDGTSSSSTCLVPGILLFHTGAGPHDVFLHWKADSLVTDENIFPNGCIVVVADILSDDVGWAWSADRTRYNEAREQLSSSPSSIDSKNSEQRNKGTFSSRLQRRLNAAIDTLLAVPGVDPTRLAAIGWCLGGLAILELSRMQVPNMKAMITFHGVFDGRAPSRHYDTQNTLVNRCDEQEHRSQVLICSGAQDPFVSAEMLDAAVATFETSGSSPGDSATVTVLSLEGARHGFTNPAQDHNPNKSFGFNADAALKSWTQATLLLRNELMDL